MNNIYLSKTRNASFNKDIEAIAAAYKAELHNDKETTIDGLLEQANALYTDVINNKGLNFEELCILYANIQVLTDRVNGVLELGYFVGDAYKTLHYTKSILTYATDLCYCFEYRTRSSKKVA